MLASEKRTPLPGPYNISRYGSNLSMLEGIVICHLIQMTAFNQYFHVGLFCLIFLEKKGLFVLRLREYLRELKRREI